MSDRFRFTRRVEFGDTDMAGIMHFANFYRFMEAAETAYLRSKGLSVLWDEGGVHYGFPRVSCSCDFFKPALFEDEVDIEVTPEKIGTKSVTYRFDFSKQGEAIAVGRISSVYCRTVAGRGLESLTIPPEVRAKLEAS